MEVTELDKLAEISDNTSQQLEQLQTFQYRLDVMFGIVIGLLITIVIIMGLKHHD